MEYDVLAELGMRLDKQLICGCHGPLTKNDSSRDLCARFIKNGDHFYDVVTRYNDLAAYLAAREDARAGAELRLIAPFLRAHGATDYDIFQFCKENMDLMPGAESVMQYLSNLLPTFITSSEYEHFVMNVCETLDISMDMVTCTHTDFDEININRKEAKELREMVPKILALRIPNIKYELNVPSFINELDIKILETLDSIFKDQIPKMEIGETMLGLNVIGTNQKAYALLEARRKTEIDLENTAYVGTDMTDYQAMDLVRDSCGLSLSFNGTEFAVRGSNVAVMAKDSTVIAVLVQEFYNRGIEAVYELIRKWDRKSLEEHECPDKNVMDAMLKANPRKLPEVRIVTKKNVDEICKESEEYRKKIYPYREHSI